MFAVKNTAICLLPVSFFSSARAFLSLSRLLAPLLFSFGRLLLRENDIHRRLSVYTLRRPDE